ncbi:MAG: squalene--hopene cyclase, partial [Polyangiaceae bacterium]
MSDPVDRAAEWLLERQSPDGWWSGELETNVTMTAEHVMLLRFLGITLEGISEGAARHILGEQRKDGSWALYHDGPADLSTTVEAYVALKLLGVDPQSDAMRRALATIHRLGGLTEARVFTKIWMAIFGVYPWAGVPSLPPEIIFFSPQMPFNLYDFSCWARGTIAPLTIVVSRRPVRPLGIDVSELFVHGTENRKQLVPGSGWMWWLDKALKGYDALPVQPRRELAIRRVVDWIVRRQESDGSWGGIQPPWVYSIIALSVEGFALDHPVMQKGLHGMERFVIDDECGWRFQACMSPVWDVAWAIRALRVAGLPREHPALRRAVKWMLSEQIAADQWGDWQ